MAIHKVLSQLHTSSPTVNGVYVDGVSITLGNPLKHVWTYSYSRTKWECQSWVCNCTYGSKLTVPAFVGNNYYCESGNPSDLNLNMLYTDDVLWDGRQCPDNNSCCDRTGQPWFFHQLPIAKWRPTLRSDNLSRPGKWWWSHYSRKLTTFCPVKMAMPIGQTQKLQLHNITVVSSSLVRDQCTFTQKSKLATNRNNLCCELAAQIHVSCLEHQAIKGSRHF